MMGVPELLHLKEKGSDLVVSAANDNSSASFLSDEEKSEIEMDKFGVSEEFYHEWSMVFTCLPRSYYLVKRSKHNFNQQCHLTKMSGEAPGVKCSFEELLINHISEPVSDNFH